MGLGFAPAVGMLAPKIVFPIFLLSVFLCVAFLTPVLYFAARKQERVAASHLRLVRNGYSVLKWQTANLFTYEKFRTPGCLFLTESSLIFLPTIKRRDLFAFQLPFEKLMAVAKAPERKGFLKLWIFLEDTGETGLLTFSLRDPDYWVVQLSARIQAATPENDLEM